MKKLFFLFLLLGSSALFAQDVMDMNGVPCKMEGDAVQAEAKALNPFKNRYTIPAASDIVSSISLQTLIGNGTPDEGNFHMENAVTIVGYVDSVRIGGIETCNCHSTDSKYRDTHIELIPGPDLKDDRKKIIVEITPRMREKMKALGIDWSTSAVKAKFEHHFVTVTGWLLFDTEHKLESFSYDQADNTGKANWRATCWEVHPITSIELANVDADATATTTTSTTTLTDDNTNNTNPENTASMNTIPITNSITDLLALILLAALLGMAGQVVRLMVGLKKATDEAPPNADGSRKTTIDVIDGKQLAVSLFIAIAVGAMAGVLAAVNSFGISQLDRTTIFAFIAAGYAGTDLIEGFIIRR